MKQPYLVWIMGLSGLLAMPALASMGPALLVDEPQSPSMMTPAKPTEPGPSTSTETARNAAGTEPGGASDPFEKANRLGWKLNYDYLDRYALRPVVHSYVKWVPQPVQNGVGNFTQNLHEANYTVNNLLVGRVSDAGTSVLRFALNSTVGLLGLVDVASDMGIQRKTMELKTVMGKATMEQGPYFMIPLYGPTTLRGAIGDTLDGLYYPYANMSWSYRLGLWMLSGLDARAKVVDQESVLDNAFDPYVSAKDFYLQYEEAKVQDGKKLSGSKAKKTDDDKDLEHYIDEID